MRKGRQKSPGRMRGNSAQHSLGYQQCVLSLKGLEKFSHTHGPEMKPHVCGKLIYDRIVKIMEKG